MNKSEVERIYRLANLDLTNKDIESISNKYNILIDFIERIFEVDTSEVENLEMINAHKAKFREDKPQKSLDRKSALENAKDTEYGYFRLKWEL